MPATDEMQRARQAIGTRRRLGTIHPGSAGSHGAVFAASQNSVAALDLVREVPWGRVWPVAASRAEPVRAR